MDTTGTQTDKGQHMRHILSLSTAAFVIASLTLVAGCGKPEPEATPPAEPEPSVEVDPQPQVEPDPIADRVAQSRQARAEAIASARKAMLDVVDSAFNDAADGGDFDRVERIAAYREALEAGGRVPADEAFDAAYLAYQEAVGIADERMIESYEQAVREYTRGRRLGMARWMRIHQGLLRSGYEMLEFEGRYYAAIQHRFTWHEARLHCEEIDGMLACVSSDAELSFLRGFVTGGNSYWLGATDELQEGNWVWLDGSSYRIQDWDPGQPDNHLNNEHYLCFQINGNLNDVDLGSDYISGFICEWNGPGPDSP